MNDSDRLWSLGCDHKNLWVEGLWKHPLNSIKWVFYWFCRRAILLQWKLALNRGVGHHVNIILLVVVQPSSFSSSPSLMDSNEGTEGRSAYASFGKTGIGLQRGMSTFGVRS